jgi:hypothetical protein
MTALEAGEESTAYVLGCHRSGTSATAKLVSLLGYSLGPEERMIQPNDANARGYWENTDITIFNDQLLQSLGGSWHHPPSRESLQAPPPDGLIAEAQALLSDTFGESKLRAWKDPRNSLTLPFWRRFISNMSFVICVRNPVDVCASLRARDPDFPLSVAADIWLRYQLDSITYSAGQPRIFVHYEDTLRDPVHQLERIASLLRVTDAGMVRRASDEAASFVAADLRHHDADLNEMLATSFRPEIAALYQAMWLMRDRPDAISEDTLNALALNLSTSST